MRVGPVIFYYNKQIKTPPLHQSSGAVAMAARQRRRAALCNKERKGADRQAEGWDAGAVTESTQSEERARTPALWTEGREH